MSATKIELGGEAFPTKDAAKKRIQAMLGSYQPGMIVNPFDSLILCDLVQRHPSAEQKIGAGIAGFQVMRNPEYPSSKCFALVRTDGTATDFSYNECLRPTLPNQKAKNGFRSAIAPDILQFKQNAFDEADGPLFCPFTGEKLGFVGAHVDHAPPDTFANLLERFLTLEGISLDGIEVKPSADNSYSDRLANESLESRWVAFHNHYANLRIVSETANLRIIGKVQP